MSLSNRSGPTGNQGSHWKNPLMVAGGPLDDCPRGIVDGIASPYKVWYEDFRENKLDGQFILSGWTVSDVGGSPTEEVLLADHSAAAIKFGGSADQGVELQFDIVPERYAPLNQLHEVVN